MSKLTAPAPQNQARRLQFFKDNNRLPQADEEIRKIEGRIKIYQSSIDNIKAMKELKKKYPDIKFQKSNKKHKTRGAFGRLASYLVKYVNLEVI